MKTMKFLIMITFALFIGVTAISCSGDDGDTGPQGTVGVDGTVGADGQDGNANVQTFVFNSPSWSGNEIVITLNELTQGVLDNDVILGYWEDDFSDWSGTNEYYWGGYFRDFTHLDEFSIRAHNDDSSSDATPPIVNKVKVIIIESSNTTVGKMSSTPKQQIYSELANADVDVNDYYAVMDYYGLE